jgi:hypothetical protein
MSKCPICLCDNPDHKLTICGHVFHKNCINRWLAIKPECPLCRSVCINTFPHFFRFKLFKKGEITINKNAIILKKNNSLKGYCTPTTKVILFDFVKRIEYNQNYFSIYYLNSNNIIKLKKIYTLSPKTIFNLCKYFFYYSNR